jgi:hypothetical protein
MDDVGHRDMTVEIHVESCRLSFVKSCGSDAAYSGSGGDKRLSNGYLTITIEVP